VYVVVIQMDFSKLQKIGSGRHSRVYKLSGVAIKRFSVDHGEKYHVECNILERLSHVNVATLENQSEEQLTLAVELGIPLNKVINYVSNQAQLIGHGLFSALVYMHASGVVHTDIKPENVILAIDRGVVVPKLIDFGSAVCRVNGVYATTHTHGTYGYSAPEIIIKSTSVTPAVDIFATAATLYEVCLLYTSPSPRDH
jgi:serine/threonine protein kinase